MRSPRRAASRTLCVTKIIVARFPPDALEFVVEDRGLRVEGGERLVHQEDVGLHRERTRQSDALAHAAES